VGDSLVIDMLNQFLYRTDRQDTLDAWLSKPNAFKEPDHQPFVDSGVTAINFGLRARSLHEALELFAKRTGSGPAYPQWLTPIDKAADPVRCKADGSYGIIYGLQSGAQFETLDAVDACYAAGQRTSQLSHNFRSIVAGGAFEPKDSGISEF